MKKISISQTHDHFISEGKGFFYLADTLWTAFSNVSMEEWEEYLDYRQMQGFNAIQINILTQWDAGTPDIGLYPFAADVNGKFDFYKINDEYFKRAEKMVEMMSDKGFIPVLAVLWGNYVPDTWMSDKNGFNIMPLDAVKTYAEYIAKLFSRFNPVYFISGDTNFGSEKAIQHYMTALKAIKSVDPDSLASFHLGGCAHEMPEEVVNSEYLDFYAYQSGHYVNSQDQAYILAGKFLKKPVKKPVINSELCYEAHAFGGRYGRYNEFNVRKAIWQSLLSGAKAGVTYGAHGLWGWYKEGKKFENEGFGGKPLSRRTALNLKGAWDASFARWVFETFNLFDIEPESAILNETQEIRISVSKASGKIVIYAPYNADIRVGMDLNGYEWTLVNLNERLYAKPQVKVENGITVFGMHDFNADALFIGIRQQ